MTDHRERVPAGATDVPRHSQQLSLTVNGQIYSRHVPAHRTLLDHLRDELFLTGTKKVCDLGHCGACTVLADGEPVLACLTLAIACSNTEITTVEGLAGAGGELSPLQEAFITCDAFQCGYCTPGQLMSAVALLADKPAPSDAEIVEGMSGNLCRCGAYQGIVDAVRLASGRETPEVTASRGNRWSE